MAVASMMGSLISAGGQLAGGLLGRASNSSANTVVPINNRNTDLATQAALFDSLGQIGFSDPGLLSQLGPYDQLISQINAMPITEKEKRRALAEIRTMRGERNLSGKKTPDRSHSLDQVLKRLGKTIEDVKNTFTAQTEYENKLKNIGVEGPFQEDVIRDRLAASSNIASLARGISSGEGSELQNRFRQQILRDSQRGINEANERLLLQAQYGRFNPSAGLERTAQLDSDSYLNAELGSIERALQVGGGVANLLGIGGRSGLAAGQLSSNVNQGALGIAANQAAAANALNQQLNINNADSIANGFAGAGNALGSGVASTGLDSAIGTALGGSQDITGGNTTSVGGYAPAAGNYQPASGGYQPTTSVIGSLFS